MKLDEWLCNIFIILYYIFYIIYIYLGEPSYLVEVVVLSGDWTCVHLIGSLTQLFRSWHLESTTIGTWQDNSCYSLIYLLCYCIIKLFKSIFLDSDLLGPVFSINVSKRWRHQKTVWTRAHQPFNTLRMKSGRHECQLFSTDLCELDIGNDIAKTKTSDSVYFSSTPDKCLWLMSSDSKQCFGKSCCTTWYACKYCYFFVFPSKKYLFF